MHGLMQGINIRHRATEIIDLVSNPTRLQEERRKAAENKAKYTGVSGSQMRAGGPGFGNAPSRGTSGGFNRSSLIRPGDANRENRSSSGFDGFGSQAGGRFRDERPSEPVGAQLEFDDSPGSQDVVRATQARIASMKLSEKKFQSPTSDSGEQKKPPGKKLSDVKANPKIAASLGLKVPSPQSKASRNVGKQDAPVEKEEDVFDLLGQLDTPVPETDNFNNGQQADQDEWNPFEAPSQEKSSGAGPLSEDLFSSLHGNPTSNLESKQDIQVQAVTTLDPFKTSHLSSAPEQQSKKVEASKDPFADLLM